MVPRAGMTGRKLRRTPKSRNTMAYLQRAHSQPDGPARGDDRKEMEAAAKLEKRDGYRAYAPAAALQDGIRKFAAGEEAGLLTVDGQDVGLRQDLEQAASLQGLDGES